MPPRLATARAPVAARCATSQDSARLRLRAAVHGRAHVRPESMSAVRAPFLGVRKIRQIVFAPFIGCNNCKMPQSSALLTQPVESLHDFRATSARAEGSRPLIYCGILAYLVPVAKVPSV